MKKGLPVCTLKDLMQELGLYDPVRPVKYTEIEMVQLINLHIKSLEGRLAKAREVFKEQRKRIKHLESPELWRFGITHQAPPDYKAEYLRRLKSGGGAPKTRIFAVKQPPEKE